MNTRIGIAALILLAACGTSRDAGTSGDTGSAPLALTPHLTLDLPLGTTDSVLVGSLRDATRLSDGRLALLDSDRNRLVFVDSTGKVLATSGREGGGPGEFILPTWMERCAADSIFVLDSGTERFSIFDTVGNFVRSFHSPTRSGELLACGRNGTFASLETTEVPPIPTDPHAEPTLYHGDLLIFNSLGETLHQVHDLPLGAIGMLRPLAAVAVIDSEPVVGISSSPLLRRYRSDGSLGSIDTIPLAERPVTDSLYSAEIDRNVNRMGGDTTARAKLREMLATIPKPDFAPLYQLLQVTPDGTEWLVTSLPTDPITAVTGRLPDGRLVSFTLPITLTVYEIGTDYLLGKSSGADGQSHLMMYRWELPTG